MAIPRKRIANKACSEDDDEEDETAALMRELEKIKRERAEQRAKEVSHNATMFVKYANIWFRKQKRQRKKRSKGNTTLLVATLC